MRQLSNMVLYSRFKENLVPLIASVDEPLTVKANRHLKKLAAPSVFRAF